MADVFVQYDYKRKLLACGYFTPSLKIKLGEDDKVYTVKVMDVPEGVSFGHVADLLLCTIIRPPRFLIRFDEIGPNKEIMGQALTLEEAAEKAGRTPAGLKTAVSRGHIPTFRLSHPKGGQPAHTINSKDLEIYLATAYRKPGPRPKG